MLDGLGALLDWLRTNYRSTLATIASLTAHSEITFDLLYAILIPRSIVVTRDHATGEQRCLSLLSAKRDGDRYTLTCESVEIASPQKGSVLDQNTEDNSTDDDGELKAQKSTFDTGGRAFGKYIHLLSLRTFGGTQKINRLSVYPLVYHTDPEKLKVALIKRGRKWASLNGIQHVFYHGLAGMQGRDSYVRYNVSSASFLDTPKYGLLLASSCIGQFSYNDRSGSVFSLTSGKFGKLTDA